MLLFGGAGRGCGLPGRYACAGVQRTRPGGVQAARCAACALAAPALNFSEATQKPGAHAAAVHAPGRMENMAIVFFLGSRWLMRFSALPPASFFGFGFSLQPPFCSISQLLGQLAESQPVKSR